jgi:glycosyltransferase 2 family protein
LKVKLISAIKIAIFFGLGVFLIWLSIRELKPALATLQNGIIISTPDENWKTGSEVFTVKEKDYSAGRLADGTYLLDDGASIKIASGKLAERAVVSASPTEGKEKGLRPSDKFSIKKSIREANYWWLGLSFLIGLLSHVIRAYRWEMLLQPMGYKPRFLNSFFAVMVGYLVNYGVPRAGEISRCGVIDRYEKIPFNRAFGTVVAERVLDMIFFLLIFVLMLALEYSRMSNYIDQNILTPLSGKWHDMIANRNRLIILVSVLAIICGLLFVFRKKIRGKLAEKVKGFLKGIGEGLGTVRKVKRPVYFIFLTTMIWVCYYAMMHVCFYCFPGSSGLSFGAGIAGFVFGTFTVMLTPGGIGAYPIAFQKVLGVFGLFSALGYSIGWLSWLTSFVCIVLLGLISLILLPIYNKKNKNEPTA